MNPKMNKDKIPQTKALDFVGSTFPCAPCDAAKTSASDLNSLPHSVQNFTLSGCSLPQLLQYILFPSFFFNSHKTSIDNATLILAF